MTRQERDELRGLLRGETPCMDDGIAIELLDQIDSIEAQLDAVRHRGSLVEVRRQYAARVKEVESRNALLESVAEAARSWAEADCNCHEDNDRSHNNGCEEANAYDAVYKALAALDKQGTP